MNLQAGSAAHRFTVRSAPAPDVPLRVLNLLAQQGLSYEDVSIRRDGEAYAIAVTQPGLDAHRAGIILEKMRALVFVEQADLHCIAA